MCTAFIELGPSLYKLLTSLNKIYIPLFLLLYSIQVNSMILFLITNLLDEKEFWWERLKDHIVML